MILYIDIWGPSRVKSKKGFPYFVTFIDDHSRCAWLYLMKDRSELQSLFTSFCNEISTQFGHTIRVLRSDNAKEYCSHAFQAFLSSRGIVHSSFVFILHNKMRWLNVKTVISLRLL